MSDQHLFTGLTQHFRGGGGAHDKLNQGQSLGAYYEIEVGFHSKLPGNYDTSIGCGSSLIIFQINKK